MSDMRLFKAERGDSVLYVVAETIAQALELATRYRWADRHGTYKYVKEGDATRIANEAYDGINDGFSEPTSIVCLTDKWDGPKLIMPNTVKEQVDAVVSWMTDRAFGIKQEESS